MSFWGTASEDLQGGGVFSVVVGLCDDLHVLIEGDEEAEKALHAELAEVAAQQLGESRKSKSQGIGVRGIPLLAKNARNGAPICCLRSTRGESRGARTESRFLTGLGARFGMTRC